MNPSTYLWAPQVAAYILVFIIPVFMSKRGLAIYSMVVIPSLFFIWISFKHSADSAHNGLTMIFVLLFAIALIAGTIIGIVCALYRLSLKAYGHSKFANFTVLPLGALLLFLVPQLPSTINKFSNRSPPSECFATVASVKLIDTQLKIPVAPNITIFIPPSIFSKFNGITMWKNDEVREFCSKSNNGTSPIDAKWIAVDFQHRHNSLPWPSNFCAQTNAHAWTKPFCEKHRSYEELEPLYGFPNEVFITPANDPHPDSNTDLIRLLLDETNKPLSEFPKDDLAYENPILVNTSNYRMAVRCGLYKPKYYCTALYQPISGIIATLNFHTLPDEIPSRISAAMSSVTPMFADFKGN